LEDADVSNARRSCTVQITFGALELFRVDWIAEALLDEAEHLDKTI
jgi:hypothetical protein